VIRASTARKWTPGRPGTCWISAFVPASARQVLALPNGVEPIAFTPLGYPADSPRPKQRKPLAEMVR